MNILDEVTFLNKSISVLAKQHQECETIHLGFIAGIICNCDKNTLLKSASLDIFIELFEHLLLNLLDSHRVIKEKTLTQLVQFLSSFSADRAKNQELWENIDRQVLNVIEMATNLDKPWHYKLNSGFFFQIIYLRIKWRTQSAYQDQVLFNDTQY